MSMETRFVALSAFAVSLPLAFAVVITRERKQPIAKSSLREPLYTLCYCTAPVFMMATPLWVIWVAQLSGSNPEVMLNLARVWRSSDVLDHLDRRVVVAVAPGYRLGRALVLLGKAYFVFLGLMLLLEVGILTILGTIVLGPH